MRTRALAAALCLALSACEEGAPPSSEPPPQPSMGGVSATSSGGAGGGDISLDFDGGQPTGPAEPGGGTQIGGSRATQSSSAEGSIANRYQAALDLIRKKDWDGAREQLLEALRRSEGTEAEEEIQGHLRIVERGILAQPADDAAGVLGRGRELMEKRVSARGRFASGGPGGQTSYYFWLDSGGRRIQCRYHRLTLGDKKKIARVADGSRILVRGLLRPPWGNNRDPYLDLSYFRLEAVP